jgi:hypothetical protein
MQSRDANGPRQRVAKSVGTARWRLIAVLTVLGAAVIVAVVVITTTEYGGESSGAARSAAIARNLAKPAPVTRHAVRLPVSSVPTGPPTPAGGWSVVYADAFGAPIGRGRGDDNTWFPNNCSQTVNCAGFNADEPEVMNPSAVEVTSQGLRLKCTHTTKAQSPGAKHYVCGMLRGQNQGVRGYSFFTWSPGKGQTLVFQAVAKFPPNTGEADPAWWTNGPPWDDTEVDFFEGYGASSSHTTGWKTDAMYTAWFAHPHANAVKNGFATDPSQAFHTYTFEIAPDNTYSVWIDGALQPWATHVGPVNPDLTEKATLILSYALRTCPCTTGFTSGAREFDVKSVAVYEDSAHRGVGIENGGVAPGTVVH